MIFTSALRSLAADVSSETLPEEKDGDTGVGAGVGDAAETGFEAGAGVTLGGIGVVWDGFVLAAREGELVAAGVLDASVVRSGTESSGVGMTGTIATVEEAIFGVGVTVVTTVREFASMTAAIATTRTTEASM
jgi:hypothetical protein